MSNEKQPDMFGQLKFTVLGGKFMSTDKIFTIDLRRAVLLEKKLLKVLDEFISEA